MAAEFFVAKLTSRSPLGASGLQVLLHDDSGDLGAALAGARDGVVFA